MIVHFLTSTNPRLAKLEIKVNADDPEDLLRVKRLPRRYYDYLRELWIVPLGLGLTEALKKSDSPLGVALLALVEEQEEGLRVELTGPAPALTQAQLFAIPATSASNRAMENHLYTYHHGDVADYERVHGPMSYVPPAGGRVTDGRGRTVKKNKILPKVERS